MIQKYGIRDWLFIIMQLLLLVCYLFRIPALDFSVSGELKTAGLYIALAGLLLVMLAVVALKHNLHPFPSPKKNGTLVTHGIYRVLRHPIYIGVILIAAGYGLHSENGLRMLVAHCLVMLFFFKARYEELLLLRKFPEYREYKSRTFCLFPGVYLR